MLLFDISNYFLNFNKKVKMKSTFKSIVNPYAEEGRIRRWFKTILREVLVDHECTKFVEIKSERAPTSSDILPSTGCTWENMKSKKTYILKGIKAEWEEQK